MNRVEYRTVRRAYRDAKHACNRWKYPGSNRGLGLACARERARELVPGMKYDPFWVTSLLQRQAGRRREVLHHLATLRAYRAQNIADFGERGSRAVVQRLLRAALQPIKGN